MRKMASKNGRRKTAPKKAQPPVSELGRKLRVLSDQVRASGVKPLTIDDLQRENWHKW